MDQLAWHRVHNGAFKRIGGIAAVNRIDNLKTGVAVVVIADWFDKHLK